MSEIGYCPQCHKNQLGSLNINWIIFIILFILGIILGLIYLVYCFTKPRKCPTCKSLLQPPLPENMVSSKRICMKCGTILRDEKFCPSCGTPVDVKTSESKDE